MKLLAMAAAGAAVLTLTGCGSHSAAPGGAADNGRATAPISCSQQYHQWTNGEGKGVMDALHGVSSAATARDGQPLTVALRQAKPAVAKAAKHPIPACADPRGYWDVLLMHVNAAAASRGSASSIRAAVQDVPKIHDTLLAEVKQTASCGGSPAAIAGRLRGRVRTKRRRMSITLLARIHGHRRPPPGCCVPAHLHG